MASNFRAALVARAKGLTQGTSLQGRISFPDAEDRRILRVALAMLTEGSARQVVLWTNPARATALDAAATQALLALDGGAVRWQGDGALLDAESRLAAAAGELATGAVDGILAGNLSTTAEVIRAGIRGVGLAPGVRTVSGAFLMHRAPAETLLFADCGAVVSPTSKQLVDIAGESVRTWRQLMAPVPPVVAFLSFSTKGSAQHEAAQRVAEAAKAFRALYPAVDADGELQLDAALDQGVGARKAPGSPVPGRANILIFPNLDAGNIAYKLAQRLGGFEAYGPLLQGLSKPFNDLSRGATEADIHASALITLIRGADRSVGP